jgi:uncharacterized protein YigE (DUF2233 family)
LVIALSARLSGQREADKLVKAAARGDWLSSLLAKGSKEMAVSPSHPELKLHFYEDTDPTSPHYGLKLCWLLLPRSSAHIAVNDIRKSAESTAIYAAQAESSDVVITNGGFFGYGPANSYRPVGLVVANGRVFSPQAKWSSGGAVVQVKGVPQVVPMTALGSIGRLEQAIQSKPMLVEQGRRGIKSDPMPPFNRTSVGVDRSGNIIVAGAFQSDGGALTLIEFSSFLSASRREGGPEAMYALNLDGGPDAHMFFPAIGLHLGYEGQNFVPNAIRFYWK